MGPFFLFLVALLILYLFSSSNKINIGFKLRGIPPMRKEHKASLRKYCRFYRELGESEKPDFEKRIQYFIKMKTFVPRGMKQVTGEMKILISATAIQLTYGFPYVYLSHFKRILVYPDNYYSTINKLYHQGEVNPLNKLIVLSWRNFMRGVVEDDSGINLGLHEMAHALRLENMVRNNEFNFLDVQVLQHWERLANAEILKIREGHSSIFREYGSASEQEFFAVAIENYFERPGLFRDYHMSMYNTLGQLLQQNR